MTNYAILMFIFGIIILLVGIGIYVGKKELLPIRYYGKITKNYLKYLGKIIMLVGLSPIFSAVVALFCDENSILPMLILIIFFIINLVIGIKKIKE